MKRLLFILLLLGHFVLPAQVVSTAMYQVDAVGNKLPGALVLPADFATTTDSLVLLDFNHGTGEAGNGTLSTIGNVATASGLFANGSPLYQAASSSTPFSFVSPVTGKTYRFAVFGLQGVNSWCAQAVQDDYVIQNTLIPKYRILKGGVFITGLSAGGETTWEALAGPNANLYAAAVPMSTPPINTAICDFAGPAKHSTKVWVFHGTSDVGITSYYNSIQTIAKLDTLKKGLTHLTGFPGGHCCWASYYITSYTENLTYYYNGVKNIKAMNIYQFMLASLPANNFVFDTTGSTVVTPPALAATKAIATITVNNYTVTFDGTASTGSLNSWNWGIADSAGKYYKPVWDNWLPYGGGAPMVKTATDFIQGSYTGKLIVYDKYGGSNAVTIPFLVGTVITGPTVVQVFVGSNGVTYTLYSDNTWK